MSCIEFQLPLGVVKRTRLENLGRMFYNLILWNEGDELAIWEVANLLYMVGVKVCIYTLSPEYDVTRWVQLPNVL